MNKFVIFGKIILSPHVQVLLIMLAAPVAWALDAPQTCASIDDAALRLQCYDAQDVARAKPERSYLTRSWDLDNRDDELLGDGQSPLRPYRTSYLIVRKSDDRNLLPASPTHAADLTPADMENTEIKFQISQKAKVLNAVKLNAMGIAGFRLWAAYTQQSNWQAFNSGNSSPFRETNYEPEMIMTLSTGNQAGLKLINIGWVHNSNGRNLGESRSWNRSYVQGGWESDTVSILARAWWRIPESISNDDNPDIEDYYGRADIMLRWAPLDNSQVIDLTIRNNLLANPNRGFLQLDWATPVSVSKSTKLHVQLTSGFGESLIDYNFRQTTLGLGVSFRDW